jgi:hypothetical protein
MEIPHEEIHQLDTELYHVIHALLLILGANTESWSVLMVQNTESHIFNFEGTETELIEKATKAGVDIGLGIALLDPSSKDSSELQKLYMIFGISCANNDTVNIYTGRNGSDIVNEKYITGLTKDYSTEFLYFAIEIDPDTEYVLEAGEWDQEGVLELHINNKAHRAIQLN